MSSERGRGTRLNTRMYCWQDAVVCSGHSGHLNLFIGFRHWKILQSVSLGSRSIQAHLTPSESSTEGVERERERVPSSSCQYRDPSKPAWGALFRVSVFREVLGTLMGARSFKPRTFTPLVVQPLTQCALAGW